MCLFIYIYISFGACDTGGDQSQLGAVVGTFPSPCCHGPWLGPQNPPHPFPKGLGLCVPQHRRTYVTCTRNRRREQSVSSSKAGTKPSTHPPRSARGSGGTWNSFSIITSISRQLPSTGTPNKIFHKFTTCFSLELRVSLAAAPGWERCRGSSPPQISVQGLLHTPNPQQRVWVP